MGDLGELMMKGRAKESQIEIWGCYICMHSLLTCTVQRSDMMDQSDGQRYYAVSSPGVRWPHGDTMIGR
ncbi:hypothetical protein VTK56DRAFT_10057 [Thermocarpiscus australiensis]